MPTTYTGDPTGAATPDVAPEPETAVVVNIPIATEGRTVSSIDQAFKALANQISWLKKVKAKASAWAGLIWATRTSLGHRRAGFDHLGLPGGQIVNWIEDWSGGVGLTGNGGPVDIKGVTVDFNNAYSLATYLSVAGGNLNLAAAETTWNATTQAKIGFAGAALVSAGPLITAAAAGGKWLLKSVFTSGTGIVSFGDPSAAVTPSHRFLYIIPGDTLNDYGYIYQRGACQYSDALSFAIQFPVKLESATMGTKCGVHLGWCTPGNLPNQLGPGTAADYAVFYLAATGNWFAATRGSAGTPTTTDTGVAPSTTETRFRIEFHGATVADNTTRAVRFYINGTLVATHTTNLPVSTALAAAHFSCINYQGGAHSLAVPVAVGPTAFAQNLFGSDVF